MTRVKICGITNLEDARLAIEAGANALGFVFASSPRQITPDEATAILTCLPPLVSTIGVFMDQPLMEVITTALTVGVDTVQLHGAEPADDCQFIPRMVIKRFDIRENETSESLRERMQRYRVAGYLLDPGAGGGRPFDWRIARELPEPLILSGGLTPRNVRKAVRLVQPYAVDVCSGVEAEPGRKSPKKLRAFIKAVRDADGELNE